MKKATAKDTDATAGNKYYLTSQQLQAISPIPTHFSVS